MKKLTEEEKEQRKQEKREKDQRERFEKRIQDNLNRGYEIFQKNEYSCWMGKKYSIRKVTLVRVTFLGDPTVIQLSESELEMFLSNFKGMKPCSEEHQRTT